MKRSRLARFLSSLSMGVFCLIWLSPVLFLILTSLRPLKEILAEPFAWPRNISLHGFKRVWATGQMERYFINSSIVVTMSLVLLLALASLAGYVLGRKHFRGRQVLSFTFLAGLLIPGQVTIIPLFSLFSKLNLINSFVPLVLLNVAFGLPFSILVFTQFFRRIDRDIEDAARIDGCSDLGFFLRILMPLSGPAIATVGVLQFMWMWNDLLFALTFIHREPLRTVPLGLLGLKGRFMLEFDTIAAGALLSLVPILIAYLLFHRYLVRGLTGMQ